MAFYLYLRCNKSSRAGYLVSQVAPVSVTPHILSIISQGGRLSSFAFRLAPQPRVLIASIEQLCVLLGCHWHFYFLNPILYPAAHTTWYRGGHVDLRIMLMCLWYVCGAAEPAHGQRFIVVWGGHVGVQLWQSSSALRSSPLPHPSSQVVHGLMQAPVSSRKRSSPSTCSVCVKRLESPWRPLAVRCFRRGGV